MYKKPLSFIGIGLMAFTILAQSGKNNLPVIELHGNYYYVYEAKKNQTFFNIANDFHWDLDELLKVNSKVMSPISKGTKIYYPCEKGVTVGASSDSYTDGFTDEPEVLTHLIKKGETVYSISRMYSIPVETIYAMNPSSKNGIKAGETLKLRESVNCLKNGENPKFYVVKNGDTLYQLARTFNTTVAEILSYNPGISEKNFKAGSTIKIPANGEGLKVDSTLTEETRLVGFSSYKVEKHDNWDAVSDKTGVSVEDLRKANNNLSKLKTNMIIGVPELETDSVMTAVVSEDPRELTISGVSEIYSDVHGIIGKDEKEEYIKIGLVLAEPSSKKDIDFSRGFLSGIDKFKKSGCRINFRIFNANLNPEAMIDSLAKYDAKILFTTYEKNTPDYFADYALVSQTPVVNTFDLKDEHFLENPYFINALTPSNYFNDEIANNMKLRLPNAKLIIVGGDADINDLLLSSIEEKWDNANIVRLSSPDDLLDFDFHNGREYMIFGNVSKKEAISALSEAVEKVREDNYDISIDYLGRPNWIVYDETLKDQFHKSDVLIPARFYFDKNSDESRSFITAYHDMYRMTPAKSFPMYSAMGYDEAVYFLSSLIATSGDINSFKGSTNGVQSDFELYRPTNWSGMINPVVYLVRFSPYGKIEKQKIK